MVSAEAEGFGPTSACGGMWSLPLSPHVGAERPLAARPARWMMNYTASRGLAVGGPLERPVRPHRSGYGAG